MFTIRDHVKSDLQSRLDLSWLCDENFDLNS